MFDFIAESVGKIVSGLVLMLSGLIGLGAVLIAVVFVVAVLRWTAKAPVRAGRIFCGLAVMFGSLFIVPLLNLCFGLSIDPKTQTPLFLVITLASAVVGFALGKWIIGPDNTNEAPTDTGGA